MCWTFGYILYVLELYFGLDSQLNCLFNATCYQIKHRTHDMISINFLPILVDFPWSLSINAIMLKTMIRVAKIVAPRHNVVFGFCFKLHLNFVWFSEFLFWSSMFMVNCVYWTKICCYHTWQEFVETYQELSTSKWIFWEYNICRFIAQTSAHCWYLYTVDLVYVW